MGKQIGLIHATLNSVQPMVEAFRRYEPSVALAHFLDEGLIRVAEKQGGVTPKLLRRFVNLAAKAEESCVDGILVACSLFSSHVTAVSPLFSVPLVSVDRAMLEHAVAIGTSIGVIATVAAAGPNTARQIEEIAKQSGKRIAIEVTVCADAFAKLATDPVAHDLLIREQAIRLAEKVDVVVLAQISMARAVERLADIKVPVLTSPESGIKTIMARIGAAGD